MVATKNPGRRGKQPAQAGAEGSAPTEKPVRASNKSVIAAQPSIRPRTRVIKEAAEVEVPAPVPVVAPEEVAVPEPEAVVAAEPVQEPVAAVEPVAVAEPEPVVEPVAAVEAPAVEEPVEEPVAEAEVAVDEQLDRLASLAEEAVFEAEAIAGEAAHNIQIAVEAAASGMDLTPMMGGMKEYLRRSVAINTQFVGQFSTVRSPLDLISLQVRFLEEHRAAMLEFARSYAAKKTQG